MCNDRDAYCILSSKNRVKPPHLMTAGHSPFFAYWITGEYMVILFLFFLSFELSLELLAVLKSIIQQTVFL